MAKADIRGAYTQSGESKMEVYVRPPFLLGNLDCLWLLKVTTYGIVSAGSKWKRTSDYIVLKGLEMKVAIGLPQLFVKSTDKGEPFLLLAKNVDELLNAAMNESILNKVRDEVSQEV